VSGILVFGLTNVQRLPGSFAISFGPRSQAKKAVGRNGAVQTLWIGATFMKTLLSRFAKNESGATAIEYGLIATLIGVAIIVGATALGGALNTTFQDISTDLGGAEAGGEGEGEGEGAGEGG